MRLFPDAWGKHASKSRLMGGVGIKSMGVLMDRIMCNINPNDANAQQKVKKALKPIKPHCAWTDGTWKQLNNCSWRQLQNTASYVKNLSNMLIRVYTGVVK